MDSVGIVTKGTGKLQLHRGGREIKVPGTAHIAKGDIERIRIAWTYSIIALLVSGLRWTM